MSEPFIGQVSIVAFNFPPRGFATCDGQLLAISQNQALFSLLGTTFGGNGIQTFALPNLQGRTPVHRGLSGEAIGLGQQGGEENHTLLISEMPAHTHPVMGSSDAATSTTPAGNVLAAQAITRGTTIYDPPPGVEIQTLAPSAIGPAGSGQPHSNLQPMLTVNFVIALQGIFPSRN